MNTQKGQKSALSVYRNAHQEKEWNANELLSKKEDELNKTKATLDAIREERDQLRRKAHNLSTELEHLKKRLTHSHQELNDNGSGSVPVLRKAERIKLKKTQPTKSHPDHPTKPIHGTEIEACKISSGVAEQLVHSVEDSSIFQEIINSVKSECVTDRCRALQQKCELQLEIANCRLKHLKSENSLLHLSLQETKSKTEQLQMHLSKYESNNTALEMTLFYSELIYEAYEAILRIMERKMGLKMLQGVIRGAKDKEREQLCVILESLQKSLDPQFTLFHVPCNVKVFIDECKTSCHSDNVSLPSTSNFLKQIQKVNIRKNAIKQSIVDMSSFSIESLHSPSHASKSGSESQFDMENAVLLHELTSIKKELAELKLQQLSEEKSTSKCNSLQKLDSVHHNSESPATSSDFGVDESVVTSEEKGDKSTKHSNFLSLADLRIGMMTESEIGTELSQALEREGRLRKDNEKIKFTLEQVQQNSEQRHLKSVEVLSKLKSSYSALLDNSRREKLKNELKVKELQKKMKELATHHKDEVENLKQQIMIFEREKENAILPDNETAL